MKKYILSILLISSTTVAFSQQNLINFYKLAVGGGLGPTVSYADVRENSRGFGGYITADYNLTAFFTAGLELQAGHIKGGDIVTNPHNRQFDNGYKAGSLNIKIALGEYIRYYRNDFLNSIKGLYAGIGIGAIHNDMKYIVRYKPNTQAQYPPLGYEFPGKDKSTNLLMPVNLGINFYFKDGYDQLRYIINFNYQGNLTFGEGLDGYNDPLGKFENNAPDIYTLFSVGVKYNFGPVGYSKRIFSVN